MYALPGVLTQISILDPTGAHSLPGLLKLAQSSNDLTRARALDVLGNLSRDNPSLLTNHWRSLRFPSDYAAVRWLNNRGVLTWDGLAPVVASLQSSNAEARVDAAMALGTATMLAERLIPTLLVATNDPDPRVRQACYQNLVLLAQKATFFAQLRVALALGDADLPWPRVQWPQLMEQHRDEELLSLLSSPEEETRTVAVRALEAYGKIPETVAPALSKLLEDPSSSVRISATNALKAISRGELP
jgi:HEAT repeat protein